MAVEPGTGLLPRDLTLERYVVRPAGATALALGPDDRMTAVSYTHLTLPTTPYV